MDYVNLVLVLTHFIAFTGGMSLWLVWINNVQFEDLGPYEWKKYASYAAGPVFLVLLLLSALTFLQ